MKNSTLNIETTQELLVMMKKTLDLYASKRKSKNMLVPKILRKSLMHSLTLSISLLELVIDMGSTSKLDGVESMQRIWLSEEPLLIKKAKGLTNVMLSNPKDGNRQI